ncbi:MAG: c-type cytochrome, partial [Planctomycetales bacterium]|nr:c-type cytochrome [Planctomycetales bacterium]
MRSLKYLLLGTLATLCWPHLAPPVCGQPAGRASAPLTLGRDHPLTPAESLQAMAIIPGLRVELVACEPQVVDPIAIQFDERRRLWVVEMRDYPSIEVDADGISVNPQGRIRILTDSDGDGFFETAQLFADQLVFPTGIQILEQGVIVTMAGQVAFLEDVDGDGECDRRTTWFTGFSTSNEQLLANHPTLTIENTIHVASGLRGGTIKAVDQRWQATPQTVNLSQRDFDFYPWGGQWRSVAGNSQYGFYQDEAGRRYVCSNRNPCDLLLAAADHVANNPLQPLAQWRTTIMPAAEASQVFPLVDAWTTSNLHAGQFTAACSVYRYESDRLQEQIGNSYFACEPTGSLVQRYATVRDGLVPQTVRGEPNREFLASRDSWFRPVCLTDGPDGALYVVDMHRAVIEHPAWMPDELRERADMRWGNQAGRIYRIVSAANATTDCTTTDNSLSQPDFKNATEQILAATLAHPNRWARTTAARLLLQQLHAANAQAEADSAPNTDQHDRVVQALRSNLEQGTQRASDSPSLVRTLWLLQTAGALKLPDLAAVASNPDPVVRCQVVRLLAQQLDRSIAWSTVVEQLARDASAAVRYQWLLDLGSRTPALPASLITAAATAQGTDSATERMWLAAALALIPDEVVVEVSERLVRDAADAPLPMLKPLWQRCGWQGQTNVLFAALRATTSVRLRADAWDQFCEGMLLAERSWQSVAEDLDEHQLGWLRALTGKDLELASNEQAPMQQRLAALRRLQLDRSQVTGQLFRRIVTARSIADWNPAVQGLVNYADPSDGAQLAAALSDLPPAQFSTTLQALLRTRAWTPALLDALASQQIPLGVIDAGSWEKLRNHPDATIAERAQQLNSAPQLAETSELMRLYRSALRDAPHMASGKQLFLKHCATCHRIDGQGVAVGPDISDMRTATLEQLLLAVLDPNRAIDAAYFRYVLVTV